MLRLYNTATRRKEDFVPLDPHRVRMYVCGPTVYDLAHIGNARPVVVFDVLFRLLRRHYGDSHVVYVRNITDIDDKIMARARAENIPINELTERTTAVFHHDMEALGALPPTVEPRATEHVGEMIELIERLIASGHAYEAESHVLFDVSSDPHYGRLSRRSLDEMKAGARVEVAPYKKGPMDFVLWKASEEGEIGWDSPWGRGRPGWHIECSAMSAAHLGEIFDIHGGGIDLVFPHHENEIAQSTCGFGTGEMARIWMHNGFVQVEGRKMAKSIGNVVTVHELLETWPGEVIRLTLLATHYRQPLDFTRRGLEQAQEILDGWYRAVESVEEGESGEPDETAMAVLMDDLNTAQAITDMHVLRSEAARGSRSAALRLKATGALLGLLQQSSEAWFRGAQVDELGADVEDMIARREAARARRDFAEADRLRDMLEKRGILLKDTPSGTVWETVKRA